MAELWGLWNARQGLLFVLTLVTDICMLPELLLIPAAASA